ncbi:MAG: hypothetical protein JST66_01330 [Bacteroidetes bacterium]|nr:hypothetical protein [Bacteroidota bacterium]
MLTNLEVGVNIVPSVPTRQALQQIILHRTKHATGMGRGAVGIEFRHAMYLIKIYDKALHANVEGEILRFEVAVKKMRELEMFNIRTLHDLFEVSVWADMRTYLLRRFDELFIAEPEVPLHGLRPAQRMLVELGRDPQRLIGLDPRRRWEKLRVLRRIYARHATSSLRAELRAAIEAKATAVGPPMGAHCRVVGPALGGAGARGAYLG